MGWRGVFLFAVCLSFAFKFVKGQQPACASAVNKRAREFVGGTLNQDSALTLTPPPNQAVLPAKFCEYWKVTPDQLKNTTCYPNSPSAGLSYLLVELWLSASWNTTGTSPNWDDVSLSVYRMSNMDDDTWATRKKTGYGYTRYLDKTNGMAYHRVIVSTFQEPGAASRDNTSIVNDFDLDAWYMSINNEDASRASNGYTLKVSCVDPNTMPCPASGPTSQECNSRGTCQVNETLVGKAAPVNYCQCTADFAGYACQTSTADPAALAQAQAQSQMDSDAAFALDKSVPTTDEKKKKKSNFDARILLVLLIIPAAILALIIWRAVANRSSSQKVADEQAAKPPPPEENKDQMQSIRVDPLIVPAPILTTTVEEPPKPKWAPAPPVVVKKQERNQFQYPVVPAAAEKEPEKDSNSSTTEVPVPVDRARERFYAERSEREKRRTGSSREEKDRRSGSKGRRDGSSSRRTHTLRSVDLEEYNRMMKGDEEGLYYRKDKHGRDLLTSFDRESFRDSSRRKNNGRSASRGRDRDLTSTIDDLDDGYDTYRSGYETGRSSRHGKEEYRQRSGSSRRHGSAERRHHSAGRRRFELDTLESDITQSERQSKLTSLSDTEVESYLDFTPSMVQKIPGGRSSSRGKHDSDKEAPLYREKGSNKYTKQGRNEKDRYSSPAQRKAPEEKARKEVVVDEEPGSGVDDVSKSKVSKTRKMREEAESALVETADSLSISTLDAEPKFSSRRSRRETDADAMLEAALRRDKEKEEKRGSKDKKGSGKGKGYGADDVAAVEDVKSDVVSRASAVSKYSKDSDKLMSKSRSKSSRKNADAEGDGPSSSSGPSFQKANSRARQATHEKIPEHAEDELGEEIKVIDAVIPEDLPPPVEETRGSRKDKSSRREKSRKADKDQDATKNVEENTSAEESKAVEVKPTEEELAAKKEAEAAELRAKQAAEERRKRFAAILDQLPDINENSFQRSSREGGEAAALPRPEPVPVKDSYPVFTAITPPVSVMPSTPNPTPELQVVTVQDDAAPEPTPVKQETPAKKKGWFGFGARSSREGTPASPAAAPVADKVATTISIHEVQPAVPLPETATPASPLNSAASVDLRDGWRAIQQRYSSPTPVRNE